VRHLPGPGLAVTLMNSPQSHPSRSPEHDTELLSAYLDNQLSVAERVSLERRLAQDPELRAELAELRATAAALGALTPLRPPRSFTLDPATARRPRALFPLSWVMQLGSGMAGMLLVLLATAQLLAGTPEAAMAPMPAMATAAPAATPEDAPGPMAAPAAEMRIEAATGEAAAGAATMSDEPELGAGATAATATSQSEAYADSAGGSSPAAQAAAADEAPTADLTGPGGFPPGLTLALGLALLGFGVGWHLYSRRRA
jgi:anti-sigma factor RsiW